MFNLDNFLLQNPWRNDKKNLISWAFERRILPELLQNLKDDKPILLSGPRGAGKTILLQLAIKHLITEKNINPSAIFYFNLDDIFTRDALSSADELVKFINGFKPDEKQRLWIFLDESLRITENGLVIPDFIKQLQNQLPKVKVVFTSSIRDSSPDTKCQGQNDKDRNLDKTDWIKLDIGLVSYKEYLNRMFNPNNIYLPDGEKKQPKIKLPEKIGQLTELSHLQLTMPLLDNYLNYGVYGLLVKEYNVEKRPALLRKIYQDEFSRDIHTRREITLHNQKRQLLNDLALMHGLVLNISKLASNTKLNRKNISAFLDFLEENYYINKVFPYGEEEGMPLVYFNDNGLRNMLLDIFTPLDQRPDRRVLMDNLLYNELRIISWLKDIRFWSSDTSEVTGFCFKVGMFRHLAGVLYDFPHEKSGRWALVNFGRKIKAKKIIVFTKDYAGFETVGPSTVYYIPLVYAWILPQVLGI